MVFSSIAFIFYFLPIVLIVYNVAPKKIKNFVLLLASLLFYAYGEPKYVFLMLLNIIGTYFAGILLEKNKSNKINKKCILVIFICIDIGLLLYFKYIDFFIKNINLIFKSKLDLVNVLLPIGISFYTFQTLSYLIDVYKEKVPVQKNIINLAAYITLFPQLIAGPIVRYSDIEKQLVDRKSSLEKFSKGVGRFIIGLSKKVLIANLLGELTNNFSISMEKSVMYYWMYAFANMLQIYFDFSGYSDMAIGLGKMFGFEFMENFNYPFISTSITEFWRRWHISLGTWFRDYVYIPLGGSKTSKLKHLRNIFIVWMLTGFWHGAEWNFVFWGLYFGIFLIIEKYLLKNILEKMPKLISWIYTILVILVSFVIFSGKNVADILDICKGLIGLNSVDLYSNESLYYFKSYVVIFVFAILFSTPICKVIYQKFEDKKVIIILEPLILSVLFIVNVAYIINSSYNPFLYFRF